jgi:hypothetical protein
VNRLFWIAAGLVGLVLLMILAKPLLGVTERRRERGWVIILAALIPASAVQTEPAMPSAPAHYGWSSIHCPIDHKPYTGRDLLQHI